MKTALRTISDISVEFPPSRSITWNALSCLMYIITSSLLLPGPPANNSLCPSIQGLHKWTIVKKATKPNIVVVYKANKICRYRLVALFLQTTWNPFSVIKIFNWSWGKRPNWPTLVIIVSTSLNSKYNLFTKRSWCNSYRLVYDAK